MTRSFVVAVGGGSCSGKSALASKLVKGLLPHEASLISMNKHMLHGLGPSITLSNGEELPNNNHPLSTDNDKILQEASDATTPIVIVEGLMALHLEKLRTLSDLRIYVETAPEVRAIRRITRV